MSPRTPLIERVLAKVELGPTLFRGEPCWLWTGHVTPWGYGRIGRGGASAGMAMVHVAVAEFYEGPTPPGLEHDHACRVTACCNPTHLDRVTRAENNRRSSNGAVPLVCPQGHYKLGANLRWASRSNGAPYRRCRTCDADAYRRSRAQR